MRSGDCRKDEEAMILDPAPRDGTGIKGVSGDLVSKVDSGAPYRVVSRSRYAEMHAKDNNMKEDNGAAFHVVSAYGGDFNSGYSRMLEKDNISFCIDLQNASSVHSSSCLGVSPAGNVLSKKDGLLASHGNVFGVRSSAPCNDIDHVIDSGGLANDAAYGQGLSYVIRDGYGLHAPTIVGEHADQPALSPCGDIPRSINSGLDDSGIENLCMGPGPRSTVVDLDGVIRSSVRDAFPPLVVGSKHTIDGNI
ncbi:hypothetical protein AMTRI_Chr13g118720 [Amborella trichopoda]